MDEEEIQMLQHQQSACTVVINDGFGMRNEL